MDLDSIRKQMKMTLSESIIPEGHVGAFLTVFDGKNLATAVATRIGGHWELEGGINLTRQNEISGRHYPLVEGQVKIRATW